MAEPLWDIRTLSDELGGIALQTLYTWASKGVGPPVLRVGNRLRYRPEDVRGWLRDRETIIHVQSAPPQFDPEEPTRRRPTPPAPVLSLPRSYRLTGRDRLVLLVLTLDPGADFTAISVATGINHAAVRVIAEALTRRTENRPPLLSAAWYRAQTKGSPGGLSPFAEPERTP